MVVRFTTTYAISAWCCEFESRSWRGLLYTTLWDQVCQWLATVRWISPGTAVYSTNKTDVYYITECTGSCKSNYHTIMTTMAPIICVNCTIFMQTVPRFLFIMWCLSSAGVIMFHIICYSGSRQLSSFDPVHAEVYSIQHYVIKFSVTHDRLVVFFGYYGFLNQ
jgi:hypothetical protein